MIKATSQQYALLSGPSKLALWAILSRFKTRLAGDLASFYALNPHLPDQKRDALKTAVQKLDRAREEFLEHRSDYARILSTAIAALKSHPGVRLAADVDPDKISSIRVEQIEKYLSYISSAWKKFEAADLLSTNVHEIFELISESMWPFYSVVYERHKRTDDQDYSNYNFASWVQESALLSQSFVSRMSFDTRDSSLCLFPSLVTESPAASGSGEIEILNGVLRHVHDEASNAFLDFDEQEDVVGLVKALTKQSLGIKFDIEAVIKRTLEGHISEERKASYTDFFFFNNQIARYIIDERKPKNGNQRSVPKGILYVCSPSIDALGCLLVSSGSRADRNSYQEVMMGFIERAWKSVGGEIFTDALSRDLEAFREQLMATGNLLEVRARHAAAQHFLHVSKGTLTNLMSTIETVGDLVEESFNPILRDKLYYAHLLSYLVGHDLGIKNKLAEMVGGTQTFPDEIVAKLTDENLFELCRLSIKILILLRQFVDKTDRRTYHFQNEIIDLNRESITSLINSLKKHILKCYEELNIESLVRRGTNAFMKDRLDQDALYSFMYFVWHEAIYNVRPRDEGAVEQIRYLSLELGETRRSDGWREIILTQRVPAGPYFLPFGSAQQTKGINSFNDTFGKNGMGLVEIAKLEEPIYKDGNHLFRLSMWFV